MKHLWTLTLGCLAAAACNDGLHFVEDPGGGPVDPSNLGQGDYLPDGPITRNEACDDPDPKDRGIQVPWKGFVYEGKTYTCNRCPGGDHDLVGVWRHIHGNTEDPDTPLDDGYRERLSFDGNTWHQEASGFDNVLEQQLSIDIQGWYFCGDAPEIPSKINVFIADHVSPEGAFGWTSGSVFGADPLKQGPDKLLFQWFDPDDGLRTANPINDVYCRVGAVIQTFAGEEKLCPDPFDP